MSPSRSSSSELGSSFLFLFLSTSSAGRHPVPKRRSRIKANCNPGSPSFKQRKFDHQQPSYSEHARYCFFALRQWALESLSSQRRPALLELAQVVHRDLGLCCVDQVARSGLRFDYLVSKIVRHRNLQANISTLGAAEALLTARARKLLLNVAHLQRFDCGVYLFFA
jgi:hypothetical protein